MKNIRNYQPFEKISSLVSNENYSCTFRHFTQVQKTAKCLIRNWGFYQVNSLFFTVTAQQCIFLFFKVYYICLKQQWISLINKKPLLKPANQFHCCKYLVSWKFIGDLSTLWIHRFSVQNLVLDKSIPVSSLHHNTFSLY